MTSWHLGILKLPDVTNLIELTGKKKDLGSLQRACSFEEEEGVSVVNVCEGTDAKPVHQ